MRDFKLLVLKICCVDWVGFIWEYICLYVYRYVYNIYGWKKMVINLKESRGGVWEGSKRKGGKGEML